MTRLLLVWLVVCATALSMASAAGTWVNLEYKVAADGYDNHDEKYPEIAQCMLQDGVVQLHGDMQCFSGNNHCWESITQVFATLPLECWPGSDTISTAAKIDGSSAGYTLDGPSVKLLIGSDGSMRLSAPAAGHWHMSLEGVSFSAAGSAWGAVFLIMFVVGAMLYVGGGVGYAVKVKQAPPSIQAHPHSSLWLQLAGLVRDGAIYAQSQARAKLNGAAGGEGEKEALTQYSAPNYGSSVATDEATGSAAETVGGMRPYQLKAECKRLGLSVDGTPEEMSQRIAASSAARWSSSSVQGGSSSDEDNLVE